jgi:3-oxo-5-alpha-steroid 4-dehydrogenase 1
MVRYHRQATETVTEIKQMSEQIIYNGLIIGWFILASIVFVSLFFFAAPYGRHTRRGWGPNINNTLGWVVMETAAPLTFAACFIIGGRPVTLVTIIFLGLWEAHYLHRAFIYPFTLRGKAHHMSLIVLLFGIIFNFVNGYINGRFLFTFAPDYQNNWLTDPRFISGIIILIAGFVINRQADTILRNLRKPGDDSYRVPYGSLYTWISCPNYLGEILIWVGWAIATWSLPGLAFAVWTAANLIPRARANHRWYQKQFPEYPQRRKALIPLVW